MTRRVIIYGDELYHHGILGMKWGKKNGPPYPLDLEDHSASEKKAGWRKSLNSSSPVGSKTKDNKKPSKSSSGQEKKKGLTDKQKTVLVVGATAVATGLALYGAYKISEKNASDLFKSYKHATNYGEAFLNDFIRNEGTKDAGIFVSNYSRSTFTNGNIQAEVSNPWYRSAKKARDKLNKNFYNRITGKYDPFLTYIPDSARYRKDVDASDIYKYGHGDISYKKDYAESFGTMSQIVDRRAKKWLKKKKNS